MLITQYTEKWILIHNASLRNGTGRFSETWFTVRHRRYYSSVSFGLLRAVYETDVWKFLKLLAPELFFLILAHPVYVNVNNTGTKSL